MSEFLSHYYYSYGRLLSNYWHNLGPYDYATLLIVIAFIGWLLMRTKWR